MIAYILTIGRPFLALAVAAMVAAMACSSPGAGAWIILLVLVILEELTDALDGYFARRHGAASLLGGVLDPFVDSISRLAIYLSFALAGWIHLAVPLTMMFRDLTVAYARVINSAAGAKTCARPSGKAKAIVQGIGMPAVVLLAWGARGLSGAALAGGRWAVAAAVLAVTLWSLADYVGGAWPAIVAMARRRPT